MSQINEALKRAKAAQRNDPASLDRPRQLRPVAAEQPAPRRIGLTPTIVFVLAALLGVFLAWQIRQRRASQQPLAAANPVAKSAPATATPAPAPSEPPPTSVATPNAQTKQATMVAQLTDTPASATPVLKLQAILFSPQNSSAMISGQTVMRGDKLNGYRVARISQHTVTLVSAAETNVLTLNR